jgi:CRP/FNR family transcriptional regulator, cyclic AMP receptor protein
MQSTWEGGMVSKEFNVKALKVIPLFSCVPDGELEETRNALKVQKVGAGEVVVREGDGADKLYILVSGEVQVVKNYLEPGAQTVDILEAGSHFGEMALVGSEALRSATVVTSEECHFVTLDREAFQEILTGNPAIAIAMLEEAFRRLRQANELLATLQQEAEA